MISLSEVELRILIAFDGSGYARATLDNLRRTGGLPSKSAAVLISASEIWLQPKQTLAGDETRPDIDGEIAEYFQKHKGQADRDFTETKEILLEARAKLQSYFPDWAINAQTEKGSAAETILRKTAQFQPNLTVVGARGLSSELEAGLGSVSNKILSESPSSVRVARGNRETDPDRLKIAVCFDNSPCAMEAVKAVASRNWRVTLEIRLMVVTDLLVALIPGRAFRLIPGLPEGRMRGEQKWVESIAKTPLRILKRAGLATKLHISSGNPRIMLVSETKDWNADLIFIGANSSENPTNSLGCVASAVAARAACTVEVVRRS